MMIKNNLRIDPLYGTCAICRIATGESGAPNRPLPNRQCTGKFHVFSPMAKQFTGYRARHPGPKIFEERCLFLPESERPARGAIEAPWPSRAALVGAGHCSAIISDQPEFRLTSEPEDITGETST